MSSEAGEGSASPRVSVLIPTRNRAHVLGDCLESLCAQSPAEPMEIIVVDNGSEDGTPDLLAGWAERDPRVRAVREERLGRSRALNTGLEVARGDVVLFTDDDVLVGAGWVDAYLELLTHAPDDCLLAGGPIIPVPHDLGPWPDWLGDAPATKLGLLDHGRQRRPLGPTEWLWGANMGARRTDFASLGGWDESLGVRGDERGTYEDIEIQERVHKAGGRVWFLPDAVIQHRVHRDGVTPRDVLYRAFHGGLSASTSGPGRRRSTRAGKARQLGAVVVFAGAVLLWSFAALGLRIVRRRELVDAGRVAAAAAGYRLGVLEGYARARSGRRWLRRLVAVCRKLTFGFAARLAPRS